jgi:hypothetical protein
MKKRLLFYILLSTFSFVSAQEYLPLHLNYKPTVVYTKEKKIKIEDVLFVAIDKTFTFFDFYNKRV